MLYPTCPTCGFLLADKEVEYEEGLKKICENEKLTDEEKKKLINTLINNLGIIKYCCRMRLITYIDQATLII
jgi:DNA-directed RNA polymerase subunit N (RpoN/RPB10)